MKLAVHITHPLLDKKLPRDLTATAWGFDGLTVPEALRRVADALEIPAVLDDYGNVREPARGRVEDVQVSVKRTDRKAAV